MPHSGGGGSHGGGSHGGSHSGGGSSRPRISNTYFNGSNRYVYYLNNRPHYYYAMRPYKAKEGAAFLLAFGIIWLLFSVLIIAAMVTYDGGGKLQLPYDSEIVIDDEAHMIDDDDRLVYYLKEFQEKSGVTVGVVTRKSADAYIGDTCEVQSYNCYVKMWADERHWLIYYVGDRKDRSDDWEWNLMCGDECVRVLSYNEEDKFTKNFHRYLVDSNRYTFDNAVIKALSALEVDTGKQFIYREGVTVNGEDAGGARVSVFPAFLMFVLPGVIMIICGIVKLVRKPSQEQIAKENAYKTATATGGVQEDTCEYCGGVYVVGTVISCPHCGAPIVAHNTGNNGNLS